MNMVNTRTKPIPIKANSSSVKKSSSTSSPQSSSSSASPQTSSSSANESPATTIQTLVRSSSSRATFSSAQQITDVCKTSRSTKSASDVQGASTGAKTSVPVTHSVSPQSTFCYSSSEPTSKPDASGVASSLTNQSSVASNNSQHYYHISSDILDDLGSRFIINVPDDERNNLIRICFQIELAHWFYLDFFCMNDEKKCGMKQFAMSLFHHIPFLRVHLSTIDKILDNWKQYKLTVPTYGAILLSEDLNYVLLVQSYWAKSSWGFPKGKVNENEDPIHCAAREVYEETGYDITHLIVSSDYIESVINDQYTRLYLVRNVPLKTLFMPRTRKEIKCCEWFLIDSLPTSKYDSHAKQNLGINANSFFMIMPFIKRLKKWVCDRRANSDNVYPQFHGNKFKFNGQFPNNGSTLHVTQANNSKKVDTKMPFKVTSSSAVANQNTDLGFPYQNVVSSNSSKISTLNKRQRHKSMGDLDGLVKANQPINGLHQNNLPQAISVTSSFFNNSGSINLAATSSSDPNEQKLQKSNNRRQRLTSNTGFWKITEASSADVSSDSMTTLLNKSAEMHASASTGMNAEPYEIVEEGNLDSVKLPYSKSLKHSDTTKGIYHAYSRTRNRNDLPSNRKSAENADNQKENEATMTSKEIAPIPLHSHQSGSKVGGQSLDAAKASGSVNSTSQTANTSKTERKPTTQLSKKTMINLKRSAHFESWRTFSFTENCIANVFC